MQPPSRMRYSIESRCKMVALMVDGVGAAGGRGRLRRQPRNGVSAVAALPGGRVGSLG